MNFVRDILFQTKHRPSQANKIPNYAITKKYSRYTKVPPYTKRLT